MCFIRSYADSLLKLESGVKNEDLVTIYSKKADKWLRNNTK